MNDPKKNDTTSIGASRKWVEKIHAIKQKMEEQHQRLSGMPMKLPQLYVTDRVIELGLRELERILDSSTKDQAKKPVREKP